MYSFPQKRWIPFSTRITFVTSKEGSFSITNSGSHIEKIEFKCEFFWGATPTEYHEKYKKSVYFDDEGIKDIEHQGFTIPFLYDAINNTYVVLGIISEALLFLPIIGSIMNIAVGILSFVLWLISWIYALSGVERKIPIVSEWAEKINL